MGADITFDALDVAAPFTFAARCGPVPLKLPRTPSTTAAMRLNRILGVSSLSGHTSSPPK